jgi:excinuclease ABC subunit A
MATELENKDETLAPAGVICVRGARTHNLKNVDIDIPHNQLVVITGVSGSGKSSLAFDTLYAEGQRQYIETLSPYARQFLHQMERPDVDIVSGLEPTLCIDQRVTTASPRSTVATVTEIYDYLRLLMARLGTAHCKQCGQPIKQQSVEEIIRLLMQLPEGTKLMLLAPKVRGRKGAHVEEFDKIVKAGFVRARVDGEITDLEQPPELNPRQNHTIEAVIDRVVIKESMQSRIEESARLAVQQGGGHLIACYQNESGEWEDKLLSTQYACLNCEISLDEIEPRTFSFNSPYGACPTCKGLGAVEKFDPELVIPDQKKSLAAGVVKPWRKLPAKLRKEINAELDKFTFAEGENADLAFEKLSEKTQHELFWGQTDRGQTDSGQGKRVQASSNSDFIGIATLLEKEFATTTKAKRQEELASLRSEIVCPACLGTRLRPEARSVSLAGKAIHEITGQGVADAIGYFESLQFSGREAEVATPLLTEILGRLKFLAEVGLEYLTLYRSAQTLSGGESQRVRLATSIGSGLVGVCYILDEPSIGLHARDNDRLIAALKRLQKQGNSVLVVEHDEAMMQVCDTLIDIGPGAGPAGGEIIAAGTYRDVLQNKRSVTAQYLSKPLQKRGVTRPVEKGDPWLTLTGATLNNLQNVDLALPLNKLIAVTGVSGSGKSSLITGTLTRAVRRRLIQAGPKPGPFQELKGTENITRLLEIDQSPIGRSARSNPATYSGVFDEIRKLFALVKLSKQRGYTASRFSFNTGGGRCETCQGNGVKKIEMNFLPDLEVTCNACGGKRFNRQTLQVKFKEKSIGDVLEMSIAEAVDFFSEVNKIHTPLTHLAEVGLGYLQLGQRSTTLSGGEAQRVKLATELSRSRSVGALYILDEPTTGLHFADVERLLTVLNQLVARGNTVLVVEHHLDVIRAADWIVDLGPEGGAGGGSIVANGTPEDVAGATESLTGKWL